MKSEKHKEEQNNPAARPAIAGALEHPEDYNVVFLGYPIWWGQPGFDLETRNMK